MDTRCTSRAFILLLALASAAALAAQEYEVVDVGNLPGATGGKPTAINNHNVVVGWSSIGTHAIGFSWTEGLPIENMNITGRQDWVVTDVNDDGISTGYYHHDGTVKGFIDQHWGFMSHNIWYNEPLDGEPQSRTYGINNLNHMVGSVKHIGGIPRAAGWMIGGGFLYPGLQNGEASDLFSINDADNAAGYVTVGNQQHAAILFNNQVVQDLHTQIAGAIYSSATSINDQGSVAGNFYRQDLRNHGFYYNPEQGMQLIENVPGFEDIRFNRGSNDGIVVGSSGDVLQPYAIRWSAATGLVDLNTLIDPNSGWQLDIANDVNENGYIIGTGRLNGVASNFLLKPVPEPASLAALGLGVVGLLRRRRVR